MIYVCTHERISDYTTGRQVVIVFSPDNEIADETNSGQNQSLTVSKPHIRNVNPCRVALVFKRNTFKSPSLR